MTRRLVAALACRVGSTRLYAKPLQHLAPGVTILGQLVAGLRTFPGIEEVVLGIADGVANLDFVETAHDLEVPYIIGPESDVLGRVIACGRMANATDVFRKTTEDPYLEWSLLEPAWSAHVEHANDVTAVDLVPEGLGFEIYSLRALEHSHRGADATAREYVSHYAQTHRDELRIEVLSPAETLQRIDLRLTVDDAADLVIVQRVYAALVEYAPRIPLAEIIRFLDARPELTALNQASVSGARVWA